ncbi:30S ribosomal protein THX [Aquimarina penaris]|uniref:30S ribosomal protein THX n=1 Tax=Aquimarina penaris TaxID=3231044 RepID=UPI00403AA27A
MGRGDKKTRRGKIGIGTFGRLRPRKKKSVITAVKPKAKTTPKTKAEPKVKEEPVKEETAAKAKAKAEPKAKAAPKAKPASKKPAKKAAAEEEE